MARRGILCELNIGGHAAPERFLVGAELEQFTIGRAPGCDLQLRDANVSKCHAAIRRHRSGVWSLGDAGSTSGIYLGTDGRRQLRAPEPLEVGKTFRIGDYRITILDLDHTDATDELQPGLDRLLAYRCNQLACRALVEVTSRTGSTTLSQGLAAALLAGTCEVVADEIRCTEPVELVHALRTLISTLYRPLAGIEVRARLRELVIGAAALELLQEDTEPARAAWRWLDSHVALPEAAGMLRGLVHGHTIRPRPAELETGALPGLALWLELFEHGYLLQIDRSTSIGGPDARCEVTVAAARVHRLELRLEGQRWRAELDGTSRWLEPGTTLDLGTAHVEVLAIR